MFDFFKKRNKTEERSTLATVAEILGIRTNSVQGNDALRLVPVYSCIRYLSDAVGMTNLSLYKKDKEDNRSQNFTHPLAKWISEPQSNTTTINWFQSIMGQLSGFGNAYAVIVRNNDYTVKETIFIPSMNVSHQITINGELSYTITLNNKTFNLFAEDVLHFKGLSLDGKVGISPIAYHRSTLERSSSESAFGKNFYDNASNVGGVVTHPAKLNKETLKLLKEAISSEYGGVGNSGKTMILSEGMTYNRIEMISPTDANYVASKQMSDNDIANIFRVPVTLLNNTEASTYANVENLNVYFQMYSLNPYYKTIEQELKMKLISKSSRDFFFEYDTDSLMNSTSTQKMERLDKGIKGSIFSPNEARKRLNLNPIEGMDDILIPLNLVPLSKYDDVMMGNNTMTPNNAGQDKKEENEEDRSSYSSLEKKFNNLSTQLGRLQKEVQK